MPAYSNLEDLNKAIMKEYGLSSSSEGSMQYAKQILQSEGLKLLRLIERNINQYYIDYTGQYGYGYSPSGRYERTFAFLRSLDYHDVHVEGNSLVFTIFFDPELANHPSVMGGKDGFVPLLVEDGWDIRDKVQPERFHFTHFDETGAKGYEYVERAILEFNNTNRYGLTIRTIKQYNW